MSTHGLSFPRAFLKRLSFIGIQFQRYFVPERIQQLTMLIVVIGVLSSRSNSHVFTFLHSEAQILSEEAFEPLPAP